MNEKKKKISCNWKDMQKKHGLCGGGFGAMV